MRNALKTALAGLGVFFLWAWMLQFLFEAAHWFKSLPLGLGFPLFFVIMAACTLLPVMLVVWLDEHFEGTGHG